MLVAKPDMLIPPFQKTCFLVVSKEPALLGFILNKPVKEIASFFFLEDCLYFGGYANVQTQFYLFDKPIPEALPISDGLFYSWDWIRITQQIEQGLIVATNFKLLLGQCSYEPAYFEQYLLPHFFSIALSAFGSPFGMLEGEWEKCVSNA